MSAFTQRDLVTCGDHVEVLAATLRSLVDVTIDGHANDDPCPYQVGHSMTEHCVIGLGLFDSIETFDAAIGRHVRARR
jgi:hypothetical protein